MEKNKCLLEMGVHFGDDVEWTPDEPEMKCSECGCVENIPEVKGKFVAHTTIDGIVFDVIDISDDPMMCKQCGAVMLYYYVGCDTWK